MLNSLVPNFIKTFDKHLLLNKPFWYVCKLHYLFYFTAIAWVLSYVIGSLITIDITSYNPSSAASIWVFAFSVLAIILFCVWLYHLTIYNNEDHFGKYTLFDDTKYILVFFIGVNLLMSFSYPLQQRVKTRVANLIGDQALAQQYNALNLSNMYLTRTLEDFQYCGYEVNQMVDHYLMIKDTLAYKDGMPNRDLSKYNHFLAFAPNDYSYEKTSFASFFLFHEKINESAEFKTQLFDKKVIENAYQKHHKNIDVFMAIKSSLDVAKLYNTSLLYDNVQTYFDEYRYLPKTCTTVMPEYTFLTDQEKVDYPGKYNFNPPIYNIDTIYCAKFKISPLLTDGYLTFAFYFSFIIALIMVVFRNNTWKHFLVSVISFILIGIILSIVTVIVFQNSFSNVYPSLLLLTWLAAFIISVIHFNKNRLYKPIVVVAVNLIYITLPFMPLLMCVYLHEVFGVLKCYIDYNNTNYKDILECNLMNLRYNNLIFCAQIIGISAFVFVVMPLFKAFYIKHKALPTSK